jgi:hypothetical protein
MGSMAGCDGLNGGIKMIEQALKLAKDFDEQAEMGFEMVLRAESDSLIAQQVAQLHIKYAKEHQANAQLLRDMVAEIERLRLT